MDKLRVFTEEEERLFTTVDFFVPKREAYEKTIFTEPVLFTGNYSHPIVVTDCIFKSNVEFAYGVFKHQIIINNCQFENDFSLGWNAEFEDWVTMTNCSIKNLVLEGCRLKFFTLIPKFVEKAKIEYVQFEKLTIQGENKKSIINDLSINTSDFSGNASFDTLTIPFLTLTDSGSDKAHLYLSNLSIQIIRINEYRNSGVLKISDIFSTNIISSEIDIFNSYFGKAEFNNVSFSGFSSVNILDSHLVDCTFINCEWNYNITAFVDKSEEKIIGAFTKRWSYDAVVYYQGLRETFRQLKYAFSKQGDIIAEQHFHTMEMIAYNRTLHPIKSFFTKLIIRFSFWFSDFGQSVSRPLFWIVFGHFILFILSVKYGAIDTLEFTPWKPEINAEGVYQYFRLINPLRRPDETFKGYNIIIDMAMRIWSSYMIYNIIRASRRFIK